MMAATRRGQGQMRVELPKSAPVTPDLPPLSALFFIYFDIKAGYTIGWRRSLPGIELEGVVEYKSLPSGLHTVNEDLIYFVHDRYAGLSAFASAPASEESRNARMIAVGVLVPLSYGRLGRSWKHADNLMDMAQ
jgi:DENN domain-containing protein 11